MKVDIEIFANEGYVHDLIRASIGRRMEAAQIDYRIHKVDDINEFIAVGLESVPTIRINYYKRFTKTPTQTVEDLVALVSEYILYGTVRTIVCPVDFSPHSINALEWAYHFALAYKMHLKISHVVFPATEPQFSAPFALETQMHQLRSELEALATRLKQSSKTDIPIEIDLDIGDPIHRITQYSKNVSTGLIVLGTHGSSGILNRLFGSVSATVAQHAHVPVILIPPQVTYHEPQRVTVALHREFLSNGQIKMLAELNKRWRAHINFVYVHEESENFGELRNRLIDRIKSESNSTFSYSIDQLPGGSTSVMETLIRHAETQNPDMIVLVARNRSYLRSLLKPGMTRKIAVRTKWPLLVMHET